MVLTSNLLSKLWGGYKFLKVNIYFRFFIGPLDLTLIMPTYSMLSIYKKMCPTHDEKTRGGLFSATCLKYHR